MSASPPAVSASGGHHHITRTSGNPPGITLPSEAGDEESSISSAGEQQVAAGANDALSAPALLHTTPERSPRSHDEPQGQQVVGEGSIAPATLLQTQLPHEHEQPSQPSQPQPHRQLHQSEEQSQIEASRAASVAERAAARAQRDQELIGRVELIDASSKVSAMTEQECKCIKSIEPLRGSSQRPVSEEERHIIRLRMLEIERSAAWRSQPLLLSLIHI